MVKNFNVLSVEDIKPHIYANGWAVSSIISSMSKCKHIIQLASFCNALDIPYTIGDTMQGYIVIVVGVGCGKCNDKTISFDQHPTEDILTVYVGKKVGKKKLIETTIKDAFKLIMKKYVK